MLEKHRKQAIKIMGNKEKGKIHELIETGMTLWSRFSNITSTTYASSIAYFTFLSLVPMLALAISLLSVAGIGEQDVQTLLATFVPEALEGVSNALVSDAFARSQLAFSLSTIVLLWSASKGARALAVGLNSAYEQEETRNPIVTILISIAAGLVLDILLAVAIYLVFSGSIAAALETVIPDIHELTGLAFALRIIVTMLIGSVLIAACYTVLPAGKRKFYYQLPGAVCAMAAWAVLGFGFRIYVEYFAARAALYGTIASIGLLLLWIYMISIILLAGGFINRLLEERRENKDNEGEQDERQMEQD